MPRALHTAPPATPVFSGGHKWRPFFLAQAARNTRTGHLSALQSTQHPLLTCTRETGLLTQSRLTSHSGPSDPRVASAALSRLSCTGTLSWASRRLAPLPEANRGLAGLSFVPGSRTRGGVTNRSKAVAMAVSPHVGIALVLTCIGSGSTALGGLLVVMQSVPDMKRLGLLQGFAAGLMLSLSFFDLMPSAIESIGFLYANIWFFMGSLLFAAVVALIPEPSLLPEVDEMSADKSAAAAAAAVAPADSGPRDRGGAADAAVPKGGPAAQGLARPVHAEKQRAGSGANSRSSVSRESSERKEGRGAKVAGDGRPDADADKETSWRRRRAVLFSGVITAVGISLHNFPEGIAVFLGSMKGLSVGISLAVAIALHNIPEGLAVALPIYYATRKRWLAFRAAALSGLAEPLAVVVVALFFPASLSTDVIEGMLAGVGGIMAFLTLHEMLPLAFEYAGHRKAVAATFVGMAVMSANLHLLDMVLPHDASL